MRSLVSVVGGLIHGYLGRDDAVYLPGLLVISEPMYSNVHVFVRPYELFEYHSDPLNPDNILRSSKGLHYAAWGFVNPPPSYMGSPLAPPLAPPSVQQLDAEISSHGLGRKVAFTTANGVVTWLQRLVNSSLRAGMVNHNMLTYTTLFWHCKSAEENILRRGGVQDRALIVRNKNQWVDDVVFSLKMVMDYRVV